MNSNTYTLSSNSNATYTAVKAGAKVRIFANEEGAAAIDYPFIDDGQLFTENGKLFKNIEEFAAAFNIALNTAADIEDEDDADDTDENVEEVEVEFEGTFSTIAQLKAKVRAAVRSTQNEQLTVKVALTVTVGKQRVDGKKRLLEEEVVIEGATVDALRSKWLFLTVNGAPLYVKSFANATFTIEA